MCGPGRIDDVFASGIGGDRACWASPLAAKAAPRPCRALLTALAAASRLDKLQPPGRCLYREIDADAYRSMARPSGIPPCAGFWSEQWRAIGLQTPTQVKRRSQASPRRSATSTSCLGGAPSLLARPLRSKRTGLLAGMVAVSPSQCAGAHSYAWDAVLTYEEIEASLEAQEDTFAPFVRSALRQAADKQRSGGFVANQQASAFWAQYRRLQREEFPDLKMTALAEVQSANDPWPRFAGGVLPPRVKLEHKPWKGCVDLTFQDLKFEDLRSRLYGRLPANLEMCRTAPSSAVRATVPLLEATKPFEPQIEAAKEAFRAAEAILQLWPQIPASGRVSLSFCTWEARVIGSAVSPSNTSTAIGQPSRLQSRP